MASLAAPASTRSYRLGRLILAVLGLLMLVPAPTMAQEPLFLRIRPIADAEAARAAREALWLRRQAHARAVIGSVCTGCLTAWKPTGEPVPIAPAAPPVGAVANLTVRIGVETDPGPVASDDPDPPIPERQP